MGTIIRKLKVGDKVKFSKIAIQIVAPQGNYKNDIGTIVEQSGCHTFYVYFPNKKYPLSITPFGKNYTWLCSRCHLEFVAEGDNQLLFEFMRTDND